MSRQRPLLLASFALSIVLLVVLVRLGRVDLRLTWQQLQNVRWISLVKLVVLNVALVGVSTEKWRSVDSALRRENDAGQSRTTSFALTSAGLALGTFLPVQIAMATARTMGTYVHGSAIKRGTAGTLYEQSFDVLTVSFLGLASLATWLNHGSATMWTAFAAVAITLALLTVNPFLRLVHWVAATLAEKIGDRNTIGNLLRNFDRLLRSGMLRASLARQLVLLSTLRFVVIVLMSMQTAEAIGLHIPFWTMAATIPFVVIATLIALTPGGLGVNELTAATALSFFGMPLATSAQWTLANRVLVAVSYMIVALCSGAIFLVGRLAVSRRKVVQVQ